MDILHGIWMILQVILLDLSLGGDNSIVIGMAAKGLPKDKQEKVILFGAAGAIGARFLLAAVIVWLLTVPFLKTAGGLILIWIGMKLIGQAGEEEDVNIKAKSSFWGAVGTIVTADLIMSLDNVLAIVAATDGHLGMLILGMAVSVPIIIVGSTIVVKLMNRFPQIIYIGSIIIGWAAGGMIATDKEIALDPSYALYLKAGMAVLVAVGGWIWQHMAQKKA